METFEDKAIRLATQAAAEEQFIYKIYTYDAYGGVLTKLLKNDRTFKSIQNTMKYKQLVICQKSDKWRIVEIIEPTI